MKQRLILSLMLVALAVIISSCYASRRSRNGCPANPQASIQVEKPVIG